MIDSHHYVPVLRWKRAERAALASLRYQDRAGMTPLIEIPPWGFEADNPEAGSNLQVQLPKIAEGLLKHWGHGLILVDLCHLRQCQEISERISVVRVAGEWCSSSRHGSDGARG